MIRHPHPCLYQINTRVRLNELSRRLGRSATLDDLPDADLDGLVQRGFDWIWFLGVWQTGIEGQRVSRTNPSWRQEFEEALPDLKDEDICGSCFAITDYAVHRDFGGNPALARLRRRMHAKGLRLLLDFVPNHTALDHPWVQERPDFYMRATEADLAREPNNYCRVASPDALSVLAYGRDPYFPGWPDTLQLNYGNPLLHTAMVEELLKVAQLCDGVRCDMAMLILPEVFERTWGIRPEPFWPRALQRARRYCPDFLFMAEVYWDLEWTLQQQGFDYTYDKRLYDRLRAMNARPAREHLYADLDFQRRLVRFLENHDEPRAAAAFPPQIHQAAAIITFLAPGLRFFHEGQLEGWTARTPTHLGRRRSEPTDEVLQGFYDRLLDCIQHPAVRDGNWQLLDSIPAWGDSWTWDNFIAYAWRGTDDQWVLVAVNYAPYPGQCFLRLPLQDLHGHWYRLRDIMRPISYRREGDDLLARGLYLDMPAWGYHVFEVQRVD
jgi:hypothetical protein